MRRSGPWRNIYLLVTVLVCALCFSLNHIDIFKLVVMFYRRLNTCFILSELKIL